MSPSILCEQEIGNQKNVDAFLAENNRFAQSAFTESADGQDNVIFAAKSVFVKDLADPVGFQHPAQAAYFAYKGFDAVIVTVHLSWTDKAARETEKRLLRTLVAREKTVDPDVIIVGDFNTTEEGIEELAQATGLVVMVPKGQDGVGTTHAGNRYDHFLVSPDLSKEEAIGCEIQTYSGNDLKVAKKVSDHLPVLAHFKADNKFKDREGDVLVSDDPPPTASRPSMVYVSEAGRSFHRKDCRFVKETSVRIPRKEAEDRNMAPCKVCKP